jgi:hypothetical protein
VSGAGVQHHACLSTRPLSGVRCGRLSVQMSGVRCSAWVSGVRGFPRPLCPARRLWRGGGRQAAAWLGWPASAWSPDLSTASSSAARVGTWRSRLAQVCWVSGGVGLGLASWEVVGQWLGRPRGRQDWLDGRGDRPLVVSRGCAARRRLRCVVIVCGPGPSRLVATSLLGWTATCACGRGAAGTCSERRLLDAGDALTCRLWGGGEGI